MSDLTTVLLRQQQDKSDENRYLVAIEDGSWLRFQTDDWTFTDTSASAFHFQSQEAAREVMQSIVAAWPDEFPYSWSVINLRVVLMRCKYHPFT